jgi:hypothetical protein
MINDEFSEYNTQFSISYELLCLLRWLIEHDADKLKKIIAKAINSGELQEEMQKIENPNELALNSDVQNSIIDFFGLLEGLLTESINEQVEKRAREKDLMPAIDQIDSAICDDATVRFSLEKATSELAHNPDQNPKEKLFQELLKRWTPHNKNTMN